MSLPTHNVLVWETRVDPADGLTYRFDSTLTWVLDGDVTPSSSSFPTVGNVLYEIREDVQSGRFYKWSGSAWVLESNAVNIPDLSITTAKLATDATWVDIAAWA